MVLLVNFQAFDFAHGLRRQLIKWNVVKEEGRFPLGELNPILEPVQDGFVFGTSGLASQAADQTVVPGRVDPVREIGRRFIVIRQTSFRMQQEAVFGDGTGRTKSEACNA